MKGKMKEGVISMLYFRLGQDTMAVSKALYQLLNEGWKFNGLTINEISIRREWEIKEDEEGCSEGRIQEIHIEKLEGEPGKKGG